MIPLATYQKVLMWQSICPTDENTTKWQKLAYKGFAFMLLISFGSITLAGVIFCAKYFTTDIELALFSIYHIACYGSLFYVFAIVMVLRENLAGIFVSLSKIYDASKGFSTTEKKLRNYFDKEKIHLPFLVLLDVFR